VQALSQLAAPTDARDKKKRRGGVASDIYKMVKMIMERNYDPVIVFAFSKKECEALVRLSECSYSG
jgi:ATP-dependent RNA helicase DOB1